MSVLWKPTENVTITPRLVYQNIDMDGFNREEFFNLFANPYATTHDARATRRAPTIPDAGTKPLKTKPSSSTTSSNGT